MNRRMTRRTMLKTSALATTGLWLGQAPALISGQSLNSRINIAFIGVGGRGEANVNGLARENVVALCDVDEQRAAKIFNRFPSTKKFHDFRRMFDEMEKEIDAVVVSTPDHTHYHPSIWALEHGKHLYCEKPMAHNVWEVRQMTELARRKKVATQLGVQRHTLENVHRVVELIQSGAIGEVREVYSWVGGNRGMPNDPTEFLPVPDHLKWDLWLGPAAPRRYSPAYCPYHWRFWWDFGTGETGNWGCHILDIPFWALHLTHPTRVDAEGPDVHPEKSPRRMATHLQFPANEKRGPVTLHWSHGTPPILNERNWDTKGANNVFIGSEGALVCGFGSRKLYPESKYAGFKAPEPFIEDSPGFYEEWTRAVRDGRPATCHFDYSGPLTEAVLLGNVAYRAVGGFDWETENLRARGNARAQELIREAYRDGWRTA